MPKVWFIQQNFISQSCCVTNYRILMSSRYSITTSQQTSHLISNTREIYACFNCIIMKCNRSQMGMRQTINRRLIRGHKFLSRPLAIYLLWKSLLITVDEALCLTINSATITIIVTAHVWCN